MSRIKFTLLFLLGSLIVLIGGFSVAAYFWVKAVESPAPPLPSVTATTEQSGLSGRGTLAELQTKFASSSVECTLAYADESLVVEGSAFIDQGTLRVDALLRLGTSSVMSLVVSGGRVAAWRSDVSPFLPETLATTTDATIAPDSPLSLWSLVASYTCHAWVVDRSVFAVPGT
jgi:hypothetical protein